MRLFCAAMLALSLGLYLAYDRFVTGAPKADDQAAKLKAQKTKFGEEFDELLKRFEKAATVADKKGIQGEARELAALTAEKVRKIAEEDPKSDTALDAVSFTMSRLVTVGASGPDIDKLLAIAAEHHLNSPKVKDLVLTAMRAGKAGEKFLQTVAEKSTDKSVRGISLYILGMSYSEQSDEAETEKASTELVAKAVDYLNRAAKEAPDTKVEDGTIKVNAEIEIKSLKMLAIGSAAPELLGTELRDQKKQKLSDFKGSVVLVDVWATWCGPCRAMIPHEREMVKKLDGKPFKLISVSVDDKKDTLTKFIEKEPMPWTHWWDNGDENPLVKTLKVKAFPTLYLIDSKGVIRRKWIGSPDPDVLDKAIEELVKAAGAKG
jgi:thiol-disulfide isomerase/thioredoxin